MAVYGWICKLKKIRLESVSKAERRCVRWSPGGEVGEEEWGEGRVVHGENLTQKGRGLGCVCEMYREGFYRGEPVMDLVVMDARFPVIHIVTPSFWNYITKMLGELSGLVSLPIRERGYEE